ncbi:MAG TPA: hypothetical protein DEG06_00155 [Lachnospiraceae bacterium]|jgi:hypothetical protein|nr:hypothetical protein [Lachnospiraceae bacterium]HBY70634.1 hypothetical protein [Lachnospiraceae bacterium]HCM13848.1 hypothetical protein [Lachnospiraceae bacterium]HCR40606.1 hypothetical protein [Lachnospiraceae bacterium]
MQKQKIGRYMKEAAKLLIFSIIYLVIGFVIALIISSRFNNNIWDILAYEGIALLIIGFLISMKGNPSGLNINGIGHDNANINSFLSNEVTRQEREYKPYYKDFIKNNVVEFAFTNITLILGGIFLLILSFILGRMPN